MTERRPPDTCSLGPSSKLFRVAPTGYVRMTQRSKWKKTPALERYHNFRDEVRRQAEGWAPDEELRVIFRMPMPRSWSKKKKRMHRATRHRQKPDLDNLVKAFLDCFGEDKQVWLIHAEKVWHCDPDSEGEIECAV